MFTYRLYQLKSDDMDLYRDVAFESYDRVKERRGEPQRDWYYLVYEFSSPVEYGPDELYEIFNLRRPHDFKAHSLSVSDVIEMPDGFWYCDDFGWTQIFW